jgi:hypothetical protein
VVRPILSRPVPGCWVAIGLQLCERGVTVWGYADSREPGLCYEAVSFGVGVLSLCPGVHY